MKKILIGVFLAIVFTTIYIDDRRREKMFLEECKVEVIGGEFYRKQIETMFERTKAYPKNQQELLDFYKEDLEISGQFSQYQQICYRRVATEDYEIWIPFSYWVSSFHVILYKKDFKNMIVTKKKYELGDHWVAIKGGSDIWPSHFE